MADIISPAEEVDVEEALEEEAPPSAIKIGDHVRMYPQHNMWRDGVVEKISFSTDISQSLATIRNDMGILEACYFHSLVKKAK